MDRIELWGVRARGSHGVLAHEKRDGQDFVVDVAIGVSTLAAAGSDQVRDTIDYSEVAAAVVARIQGPSVDLIETLAEQIADDVLSRPLAQTVQVAVHKPTAPVGVDFADVVVRVRRRARRAVVIGLGSNLGDRHRTLQEAVQSLGRLLRIDAVGPLCETAPVGGPPQPDFLNTVVLGRTAMSPGSLLRRLQQIEQSAGRTREVRWGERTLDLDLVSMRHHCAAAQLAAPVLSNDPALALPHPRAAQRGFVLLPWLAADPQASLWVAQAERPVRGLLQELPGVTGDSPLPEVPGVRILDECLNLPSVRRSK